MTHEATRGGRRSIAPVPVLLTLLVIACGARGAEAQGVPVGDAVEDYARLLQVAGHLPPALSFSVRPVRMVDVAAADEGETIHPWQEAIRPYATAARREAGLRVSFYDPVVNTYWNSTRPSGQNDGPVWQGKGLTGAVTAGVFIRAGAVSMAVRPTFMVNQNAAFPLAPAWVVKEWSPYGYPLLVGGIDMPQRFGPEAFSTFDLGDSFVRLDYKGVALGLSNENLWWGPGRQNALIMSNHAPGFPHAFLGTSGSVDVGLGRLEARWLTGYLEESAYFDTRPDNDERFVTGAAVVFAPGGVRGLSLGATRMFVLSLIDKRPTLEDHLLLFQELFKKGLASSENPSGLDAKDQMLSVFGRWVLPESGFELYGEWARGDHSWDLRDFVTEPEHGSAYTLGFQKAFLRSPARFLRLTAELTRLEAPKTTLLRSEGAGFFYLHGSVRQGYTQRGQVIGAGIGPGANSQHLGLDLFTPRGRTGVFLDRVVTNNDQYYNLPGRHDGRNEAELRGGFSGVLFLQNVELQGGLSLGLMLNRYYERGRDTVNLNAALGLRTRIGRLR